MGEIRSSVRRRRAIAAGPFHWVVVALLAAGVLLAVLERDLGPWLVATAGGLATFVALAGLAVSRTTDRATRALADHAAQGRLALQSELARSRRHDRRFAIVGVPEGVWLSPDSGDTTKLGFDVARSVQGLVRRPDRAWVDGSMLHVLLTDCDRAEGLAFLERAATAMPELFGAERATLVVFPDDGITLGALSARLHDGRPEPTPQVTL